jgi:hypothetical protein
VVAQLRAVLRIVLPTVLGPAAALVYKVKAHPVTDFLLPQYQQVLLQAAAATEVQVELEEGTVKILGLVVAKVLTISSAEHTAVVVVDRALAGHLLQATVVPEVYELFGALKLPPATHLLEHFLVLIPEICNEIVY